MADTLEYSVFREHYSRLCHAIQDPLSLAIQMFSAGVITSAVMERMNVPALSRLDKNNELLSAVAMRIKTDSSTFDMVLSCLNADVSLQSLVENMQLSKCLLRWYSTLYFQHWQTWNPN